MSSIEHLITVADLEKYSDDEWNRYELIEGELFVSTAPGIPHQLVLHNLQVALHAYLDKTGIGGQELVTSQVLPELRLSVDSIFKI